MSSNATAAVVEIAAALITAAGAVGAALISLRSSRSQPYDPPPPRPLQRDHIGPPVPVRRVSRSVWLGISGLILWIIPILGIFVIAPGLYSGIRDFAPERLRKHAAAGVILCCVALVLLVINSAVGAYQGARGQLWFQQ